MYDFSSLSNASRVYETGYIGMLPSAGAISRQTEDNPMIKTRIMHMLAGLTLLAMVLTGCGTMTGAAVGAGSGAAIGAGTGHTKKGALIGTGVGAAAGAIYDFTR
jgi:hypothetical protein